MVDQKQWRKRSIYKEKFENNCQYTSTSEMNSDKRWNVNI